jgi:lipopolysaccharide export LptBFGC system permease protein LptF
MALVLSIGVGTGFLFIVMDDFLVTLGEAGVLPAAVSAWAATILFAVIGATFAFYREQH